MFTWTVNGSVLNRSFADRKDQLVVTSIDHKRVTFETPNKAGHDGWRRKDPEKDGLQDAAPKR